MKENENPKNASFKDTLISVLSPLFAFLGLPP